MKQEMVDKIMSEVATEWAVRYPNPSEKELEAIESTIRILKKTLEHSPHDDGLHRVTLTEEPDKTYLVPIKDIILNGLKGEDVKKYPLEVGKNEKERKGKN